MKEARQRQTAHDGVLHGKTRIQHACRITGCLGSDVRMPLDQRDLAAAPRQGMSRGAARDAGADDQRLVRRVTDDVAVYSESAAKHLALAAMAGHFFHTETGFL